MPLIIDIYSRGEVASHLEKLMKAGQIKDCLNMQLEYGHARAFYPRCNYKWASRVNADNVPLDRTAYSGPSSYWWPRCPVNCPHYDKSENFLLSVSRDQYSSAAEEKTSRDLIGAIPVSESPAPVGLEPDVPRVLTAKWLYEHVPISWWKWISGVVIAIFLTGVAVGHWPLSRLLHPIASSSSTANNQKDSPSPK